MKWFSNVWFVGIVTGIVSGLITTWLARLLLARRESREYLQNVAAANREVVLAIRATIPEENLPSREVIEALRQSTARRLRVAVKDTLSRMEIVQELVKEVMDSSFLPSVKKAEYCAMLLPLGEDVQQPDERRERLLQAVRREEHDHAKHLEDLSRQRIAAMSTIFGVLAAGVSAAGVGFFVAHGTTLRTHTDKMWDYPIITVACAFGAFMAVDLLRLFRNAPRRSTSLHRELIARLSKRE